MFNGRVDAISHSSCFSGRSSTQWLGNLPCDSEVPD